LNEDETLGDITSSVLYSIAVLTGASRKRLQNERWRLV